MKNKFLYVTKDLNSLFIPTGTKVNNDKISGFDILDSFKLKEFDKKTILEVDSECNIIKKLVSEPSIQLELADIIFDNDNQRSKFLGVSERTLYRMRSKFEII